MKKNFILILITIALAFLLRILYLNQFPVGIAHDEMDYIINAKAIWLTGKDISGTWSPFSLTAKKIGTPTSELLSLITSPITGPFKTSFFIARLPYAFASIILIFFLYLIVKKLIGNKTAIITAILMAINPWSFHVGRIAFDAPVAIMFYLIAFYFLIKKEGYKTLYSLPFLFFGFFSYHGTKLLFLPLVLSFLFIRFYLYKRKNENKKPILIILLFSLLMLGYFLTSLKYQSAGKRTNEFLLFASDKAAHAVNDERRSSLITPLTPFLSNKATYILKTSIKQYLGAFSTNFLFLTGEQTGALSNWIHGQFYYIDFFLLMLGVVVLYKKNKKVFIALTLLIIIAPIPSALSSKDVSYVMRSSLLFPILSIFIACGIKFIIDSFKNKKLITSVFVLVYLLFLTNYFYIYFYRYPVYGAEGFFFSERVLSEYIKKNKGPVFVLTNNPDTIYTQYLFYSDSYNSKENARKIAANIQNKEYSFNNAVFIDNCEQAEQVYKQNKTLIVSASLSCTKEGKDFVDSQNIDQKEHLDISNPADAGSIFYILNDTLCTNLSKSQYPQIKTSKDFQLQNMNLASFCHSWINQK